MYVATPDIWSRTARLREDPQILRRMRYGKHTERGRLQRLLEATHMEKATRANHSPVASHMEEIIGKVKVMVMEDSEKERDTDEEMVDREMSEQLWTMTRYRPTKLEPRWTESRFEPQPQAMLPSSQRALSVWTPGQTFTSPTKG